MTTGRILLISGSLREGSTNTALLHTAESLVVPGVTTSRYRGMAALPHFNPDDDDDRLHPAAADLRDAIRASDALLFSTPEYAGALPGSFKNLLDWTVGDAHPASVSEKPVAWVNPSTSPTGAAHAIESLRIVLGYVNATVVEDACAHIAVPRQIVGGDGLITDDEVRRQLAGVLSTLAGAAQQRGGILTNPT